MRQLTLQEIDYISGGQKEANSSRQYDWVPNAQSETGRQLNDITNMLGEAGGWIGRTIYDWMN